MFKYAVFFIKAMLRIPAREARLRVFVKSQRGSSWFSPWSRKQQQRRKRSWSSLQNTADLNTEKLRGRWNILDDMRYKVAATVSLHSQYGDRYITY